ncbi:MAG: hybrid sensor histidine kinase/response regulator [Parvibaculum sp.]|nr:hybrid sensor histidine kinase/response regulator [Parvibaculum sp.]
MDHISEMRIHRLDPDTLEIAQARLLIERARSSGFSVFCLLSFYVVVLMVSAPLLPVLIWYALGLGSIGLTLLLPTIFQAEGITANNVSTYLNWHTTISCITGAVWGIGAAILTDVKSEISVFTTAVIVLSITLGGISPQSAYRRSYVGLSSFAMLPYATSLLVQAEWPMSAAGAGMFLAYAFFMSASARVEIGTRDMLAIKQNKFLIEELARQHDALKRANEEKTRFLAATSHDLAQPLHAQGFYLAALRERTREPEQVALLTKIEASWRGLGHLLNGLVDVSRLDAGVIVPDLRALNVGILAQRISDEFAAVAAGRNIAIVTEAEPAYTMTDALILTRILRNLISNAVKFTSAGGTVHINVSMRSGDIVIAVEDTGCGIETENLNIIFDEYVQLGNPERDREKGLGLGLSIVRRLVRLLNLKLDLTSTPGQGTRVELRLPKLTSDVALSDEAEAGFTPSVSPIGNLCVLIVDNEDAIRAGMTTVLTSWGCQVFSARSGADLVDILDQAGAMPQVLLVDQRLSGGETGIQVIERLRDEINETVPAILMTGDIDGEEIVHGVNDITLMYKPIEPERLHETLKRVALATTLKR